MITNKNRPDHHHNSDFPESIARQLNHAAGQLDADTVAALHRARNIALAKQVRHKPVLELAGMHGLYRLMPHSPHQWLAAIILLGAILVSAASYWHHEREHEASHLDIAILTDDMPMEIFID